MRASPPRPPGHAALVRRVTACARAVLAGRRVRDLLALRRATPALQGHASTRVVHEGYPFAYVRGDSHLVAVNPRRESAAVDLAEFAEATQVWGAGATIDAGRLTLDGFGYAILRR